MTVAVADDREISRVMVKQLRELRRGSFGHKVKYLNK
jgi:hypothetical protein